MYINVAQSQTATSRHIHKVINRKGPESSTKRQPLGNQHETFILCTRKLDKPPRPGTNGEMPPKDAQCPSANCLSTEFAALSALVTFCQKHTEREMANDVMSACAFLLHLAELSHDPLQLDRGMTPQVHGIQRTGKRC